MEVLKAWLRRAEADQILQLIPLREGKVRVFVILPAHDLGAASLGRILFDSEGYWIYDGDSLKITEQEQLAAFIQKKVANQ